ncbi:MAG: hypothetical protein IKI41_06860, partial [Clostridia bacterium]|nr:hypothetical protein [Clostridia bacterium]
IQRQYLLRWHQEDTPYCRSFSRFSPARFCRTRKPVAKTRTMLSLLYHFRAKMCTKKIFPATLRFFQKQLPKTASKACSKNASRPGNPQKPARETISLVFRQETDYNLYN